MHPVVMLAGGLGTRVASLTGGVVPKALLEVAGRPFLDRRLAELRAEGVTDVVLLVGHGADQLCRHVQDTDFGLDVVTVAEGPTLLGTAGAVAAALDRLPDAFWVTYGDTFLEAPMARIQERFDGSDALGLMTVLRNEDRWQRSNVAVAEGRVVDYDKSVPPGTFHHIDYGLLLFRRAAFGSLRPGVAADLSEVIGPLIRSRALLAVEVDEPFHDIGTPEALAATERWIADRDAPGRT